MQDSRPIFFPAKTINLKVEPSESIAKLAEKFQEKEGIQVENQKLIAAAAAPENRRARKTPRSPRRANIIVDPRDTVQQKGEEEKEEGDNPHTQRKDGFIIMSFKM